MHALDPESPEMPRSEWTQAERDRDDLANHLIRAHDVYNAFLEFVSPLWRLFDNENDLREAHQLYGKLSDCILAEIDRRKKALREFDEQH